MKIRNDDGGRNGQALPTPRPKAALEMIGPPDQPRRHRVVRRHGFARDVGDRRDLPAHGQSQAASRISELLPQPCACQTAFSGEGGVATKVGSTPMPVLQMSTT